MDAQSVRDQGNLETRSAPLTLCHVPWAISCAVFVVWRGGGAWPLESAIAMKKCLPGLKVSQQVNLWWC